MKSYLSTRKQFLSINGTDSESFFMKYGVPQGSILGPILIIIYININDITPETAYFAKFILYADDANIILTADTIQEIDDQLQKLIIRLGVIHKGRPHQGGRRGSAKCGRYC